MVITGYVGHNRITGYEIAVKMIFLKKNFLTIFRQSPEFRVFKREQLRCRASKDHFVFFDVSCVFVHFCK